MSSNAAIDAESNYERLINALTTREIRHGIQRSDANLDANASRDEVLEHLRDHPSEADNLREDIITGAKERVLEDKHVKIDNIENAGQEFSVIRDTLSLRETYYYDSYFRYTDHTARVYQISELGGVLRDIADGADTTMAAREVFIDYCEDNDLDSAYVEAGDDTPTALIGNIEDNYRPRVMEFENADTLYIEYWQRGKTWSELDVRTGDYEKIKTLHRTALRVYLDTGLVETLGDESQKSNEGLVERFLSEFNESAAMDRINIRSTDIREAKDNLAILSSLNEFLGDEAKVRFTRNRAGNAEADPAHDQMERERDYSRSNFQVIIGRDGDEWNIVYPVDVDGDLPDEEDEVSVGDILSALETDYDDVEPLTISLDSGKSTYRIQKKALSPSTREQVFDLLADELGWT